VQPVLTGEVGAVVGVIGMVEVTGGVAEGPLILIGVGVGVAVEASPQATSIKARIKAGMMRGRRCELMGFIFLQVGCQYKIFFMIYIIHHLRQLRTIKWRFSDANAPQSSSIAKKPDN
jgi:hypothetical protein